MLLANEKPEHLTEWEFFVWRHRGTKNLIFHGISYFGALGIFYVTYQTQNFWYLLLMIPTQYIGYLGHKLFEEGGVRSKDLISPMTGIYLTKILIYLAFGKYSAEIAKVSEKIRLQESQPAAKAN